MKNKLKSNWIWILLSLAFVSIVVVGFFMLSKYRMAMNQINTAESYKQYYAMIVDDNRSAYWKSIYESAYEYGMEKDIYVELMGNNLLQDYSKEELLEIAIASDVDGIIVSADETERFVTLIDEAIANGIMVVTLQDDAASSKRLSYIGLGNYNLGREYGKQILNLAKHSPESLAVGGKTVIDVTMLVDAKVKETGLDILSSAITETVGQDGNIIVNTVFVAVDSTNTFASEEIIRDIFMQGSQPDVIVCLSELTTVCAYQTVVDYNKVGQVDILGYYTSDTILSAIDHGVIAATMVIDTKQLGKYCVDALNEYHMYGNTSQYYSADITIVNKENVSEYIGGDADDN